MEEPVRIYVGADRSQELAVNVLEYSIKRHTNLKVELHPMVDLDIPHPKDPRQDQRTGFSFSRFCIPALAGYKGKAIYMDADMLVFKDIASLWNLPFNGAKVIIQEELTKDQRMSGKKSTAPVRKKQCAVMLMDCDALRWDIKEVVRGLNEGKYNYEKLMYDFCLLREDEISYALPFQWNSLEHWNESTCLIHYTDMMTQPWVSPFNRHADVWFAEVNHMIAAGALSWETIQKEIDLGYFRPSLIEDLKNYHTIPKGLKKIWALYLSTKDKIAGYKMHKKVHEASAKRAQLIKEYAAKKENVASPT